jgi:hypothetical protein
MRGNQQSYRSLFRTFMLAGWLVSLAALFAVGALAQEAVPPTARQAASMPKYASRLAHARTAPLNPSRLSAARLNHRIGSSQDQVVYDNGPSTYTADAWTINFGGFSVTDSLGVSSSSTADAAAFVLWLSPGDTAPAVDLWIGTSPFANDVASFSGLASTGSTNLGSNQYGFNVEQDSYSFSGVNLNAGTTYWVTLQNANVPSGDPVYWDENSGPSMAQENELGTIPSESFSILGGTTTTTAIPCFDDQQQGFRVIQDFSSSEGRPVGVIVDKSANLYGTSSNFDTGVGIAYKLAERGAGWILNSLTSFTGEAGGDFPSSVIVGPNEALYGSADGGLPGCGNKGCGLIFSLRPPPNACAAVQCDWTKTVLHEFTGGTDAANGGVGGFDQEGNLYGYANGGAYGQGSIYELSPGAGDGRRGYFIVSPEGRTAALPCLS